MGSDNNSKHVYDLRRIEDIFACLEIISIARGVLFCVNPEIAGKMEKVSDALGAFSQLVLEGGLTEQLDAPPEIRGHDSGAPVANPLVDVVDEDFITDLTTAGKMTPASSVFSEVCRAERKKKKTDDMETGIVDILTGERIK